jgi:hypothetical protein
MRLEGSGVDSPFDDAARDMGAEQHPQQCGSGADATTPRTGPVELRTRAEYYEALRVADEEARRVDSRGTRTERSGWEAIDAEKRPALDALRLTPERLTHILDGDSTGGGHRHGTGKPGKTEFPASWDDRKVTDVLVDVAQRPDQMPGHQEWNGRWIARGTRDDVEVVVVVAPDGRIWSGWPLPGGAGVVKNPEGS